MVLQGHYCMTRWTDVFASDAARLCCVWLAERRRLPLVNLGFALSLLGHFVTLVPYQWPSRSFPIHVDPIYPALRPQDLSSILWAMAKLSYVSSLVLDVQSRSTGAADGQLMVSISCPSCDMLRQSGRRTSISCSWLSGLYMPFTSFYILLPSVTIFYS